MNIEEMTVTIQHDVAASPAQVWGLLTDVEAMAGLGPEHVAASWQGETRGVGATFIGRNELNGNVWEVPCTVTVYDEPRSFGWLVGDPAEPTAFWSYELAPCDWGTRVVQTFTHGPGFSYVRASVDRHPQRAESVIAARTEMLRANMTTVLAAAATRLIAGSL